MPQAAFDSTENHAKIIPMNRKFCFEQMKSTEETTVFDQMTDKVDNEIHRGMEPE